jgi:uncharacterized protein with HEPN domain
MPSDKAASVLRDIEHHIDLANHFVAGLDCAAFCADTRTVYAVTRCLEIISEASRRVPAEIKERHPAIAWKAMAGAGSIYRHEERCSKTGSGDGPVVAASAARGDCSRNRGNRISGRIQPQATPTRSSAL